MARELWAVERSGNPIWNQVRRSEPLAAVAATTCDIELREDVHTIARYIPSPTWRPIAEMPEEWRDGRYVVAANVDGIGDFEPFLVQVADEVWVDSGGARLEPTHYLDLAIPEVPRG
jgi:hypothetical protein